MRPTYQVLGPMRSKKSSKLYNNRRTVFWFDMDLINRPKFYRVWKEVFSSINEVFPHFIREEDVYVKNGFMVDILNFDRVSLNLYGHVIFLLFCLVY